METKMLQLSRQCGLNKSTSGAHRPIFFLPHRHCRTLLRHRDSQTQTLRHSDTDTDKTQTQTNLFSPSQTLQGTVETQRHTDTETHRHTDTQTLRHRNSQDSDPDKSFLPPSQTLQDTVKTHSQRAILEIDPCNTCEPSLQLTRLE